MRRAAVKVATLLVCAAVTLAASNTSPRIDEPHEFNVTPTDMGFYAVEWKTLDPPGPEIGGVNVSCPGGATIQLLCRPFLTSTWDVIHDQELPQGYHVNLVLTGPYSGTPYGQHWWQVKVTHHDNGRSDSEFGIFETDETD